MKRSKNKVSITPDTSILKRLSATNMRVERALAELIDNSLDSFSMNKSKLNRLGVQRPTVKIYFGDKVTIADNCFGMDEKVLIDSFCLGKSNKGKITLDLIGRYGIGMKAAAMILGNCIAVTTRRPGAPDCIEMALDAETFGKDGWNVDAPKTVKTHFEHGTLVEISKLRRQYNQTTKDKVKNSCSRVFRQYIRDNELSLFIDDEPIAPYNEDLRPGTHRPLEIDLGSEYGKVSGWVGLLKKGQGHSGLYGFSLFRNKRVIEEHVKIGVTNNNSEGSIIGEIFLGNWEVDFTKARIPEELDCYKKLDKLLREAIKPELVKNKEIAHPGEYAKKGAVVSVFDTRAHMKKILEDLPDSVARTITESLNTGERQRSLGTKTIEKYQEELSELLARYQVEVGFRPLGKSASIIHSVMDDQTGLYRVTINEDRPFVKSLDNQGRHALAALFAAQVITEQSLDVNEKENLRSIQNTFLNIAEKALDKK